MMSSSLEARLPEGTEVALTVAIAEEIDDEARAQIVSSIERSMDQIRTGDRVDAGLVIARLLARE